MRKAGRTKSRAQGSTQGVHLAIAGRAPHFGILSSTSHVSETCLYYVGCFSPIKLCDGPLQIPVNGKRLGFGGKADLDLNPSHVLNSGWNPE